MPGSGQSDAVSAGKETPVSVAAVPETGKTACMTMRMLELICIDDVLPRGILPTTFTKGAAGELRLLLLGLDCGVHEWLLANRKHKHGGFAS